MSPSMIVPWIMAVVLAGAVTIAGENTGCRWQVYISKPLTTVLILIGAWLLAGDGVYGWLVVIGLLFSLAGDVFLMLPADRFRAGLASFLVAHLFYIAALAQGLGWGWVSLPVVLVVGVLWLLFLGMVLPGARGQRLPVAIYGLVLLVMAATALARAEVLGGLAICAAVGALLFVISDASLGVNRFLRTFPAAQTVILGTYFPAQLLIAISIGS